MMKFMYKLSKSVIPMILLTLSVGWCYAWSLFSIPIAEYMNISKNIVQFTFCLNILLLGLGAAFFGNIVERHIKFSALLSTFLLIFGFLLTTYGLNIKNIYLIYLGCGVCCGLSQGIAYVISPKNLLLWWNKTKYKATIMSLSIICFGLGSSLCSILFNWLYPIYGIQKIFIVLGSIYVIMMGIATLLINKPKYAIIKIKKSLNFDYIEMIKTNVFWRLWFFMFLNISAGLILIGNCASILNNLNLSMSLITFIMLMCGLSNGFGRLLFPIIMDHINKKLMISLIILSIEICIVIPSIWVQFLIPIMIILINSCYGAGFSVLPNMILQIFGKDKLTIIHSAVLSAWGIASIFAYACLMLLKYFNINSMNMILILILIIYCLNFINSIFLNKSKLTTVV